MNSLILLSQFVNLTTNMLWTVWHFDSFFNLFQNQENSTGILLHHTHPGYITHILATLHTSWLSNTHPGYITHILATSHISWLHHRHHGYITHILATSHTSWLYHTFWLNRAHPGYIKHILATSHISWLHHTYPGDITHILLLHIDWNILRLFNTTVKSSMTC